MVAKKGFVVEDVYKYSADKVPCSMCYYGRYKDVRIIINYLDSKHKKFTDKWHIWDVHKILPPILKVVYDDWVDEVDL